MKRDREFAFTYRFNGAEWTISIFADDPAQAREKIKQVALARYDGEIVKRIPVPGAGWIAGWLLRRRDR